MQTHCKWAGPERASGRSTCTVLPATGRLNPTGKDSGPITTQSSPAVTHCILAAPQFTYPEAMEGRVNLSARGSNPGRTVW
jgi:hypothetical protein